MIKKKTKYIFHVLQGSLSNSHYNLFYLVRTDPNLLSDNLPHAGYTPPLLEVAADDDTKGEEEAGRENTGGGEVILYVTPTVGTGGTEIKQEY